jgi:sirohydrochlorin ferrochelatase
MSLVLSRRPVEVAPHLGRVAVADVVLAAHGSRDPRAAVDTAKLIAAVASLRPDLRVRPGYLDFTAPALGAALDGRHGPTIVLPLLLTPAYHARVDVPAVVAAARDRGLSVTTAAVLGPVDDDDPALDLLVRALVRRLVEAATTATAAATPATPASGRRNRWDAVVLGAAGSRDERALATVDRVARALGDALGVPARAGYASGVGEPVGTAVAHLAASGASRIAYASFFLAAGRLADRAAASAKSGGAAVIATPLVDAPELVELIGIRFAAASRYGDS